MNARVTVTLNIQPFGSVGLQIPQAENHVIESETEMPRYVEPLMTNIEKVDIPILEDGETYSVPKTTAGSGSEPV